MKDAVATMGALLPEDAGGRDAVHVAVFSATSPVRVYAGQKVGAVAVAREGDAIVSPVVPPSEFIGIVDPFVAEDLYPGARFWVFLFPRTITALAHRWSHPAFEEATSTYAPPSARLESDLWLTKFCAEYDDRDYNFSMRDTLKRIFDGKYDDDEYLIVYGTDEKGAIPSEVWHHASVVFGQPIPKSKPSYFSCSC